MEIKLKKNLDKSIKQIDKVRHYDTLSGGEKFCKRLFTQYLPRGIAISAAGGVGGAASGALGALSWMGLHGTQAAVAGFSIGANSLISNTVRLGVGAGNIGVDFYRRHKQKENKK